VAVGLNSWRMAEGVLWRPDGSTRAVLQSGNTAAKAVGLEALGR
jgi:hypothetical protein